MFPASLWSPHLKFKIQSGPPRLPVQGGAFRTSCWTSPRSLLSGCPVSVVLVLSPFFAQESEECLPDPVILFLTASKAAGQLEMGRVKVQELACASTGRGEASKPPVPSLGSGPHPAVGAAWWGSRHFVMAQTQPQKLRNKILHR